MHFLAVLVFLGGALAVVLGIVAVQQIGVAPPPPPPVAPPATSAPTFRPVPPTVIPTPPSTPPVSPPPATPAPTPRPSTPRPITPRPVAPLPGGVLEAEFRILFVDRITGAEEPIPDFSLPSAGLGGPCPDIYVGPGGPVPGFSALCTWRETLVSLTQDLVTDSRGRATLRVNAPSPPAGVADPFGKTFGFFSEVKATFDHHRALREGGWDFRKFNLVITPSRSGPPVWAATVTITGFRGDLPARYR